MWLRGKPSELIIQHAVENQLYDIPAGFQVRIMFDCPDKNFRVEDTRCLGGQTSVCGCQRTATIVPVALPEKTETPIIDAMVRAQLGSSSQINAIEAHMKEYFTRWPNYKDKFTHLEWYHIFLDFTESLQPQPEESQDELFLNLIKIYQRREHSQDAINDMKSKYKISRL